MENREREKEKQWRNFYVPPNKTKAFLQSLNIWLESWICLHFEIQKHKYNFIFCEISENAANQQNQQAALCLTEHNLHRAVIALLPE